MIEVGIVYYQIYEYYLGVVLEIKLVNKKLELPMGNSVSEIEYQVISLTEQGLKLNKFWTLDRDNPKLKMEFPWKPIS